MVDAEVPADGGLRVNVDARDTVGVLCHHSRNQRHLQHIELVGDAVDGDGQKSRVGEDDVLLAVGRRVAVKCRLQIRIQKLSYPGYLLEEPDRHVLGNLPQLFLGLLVKLLIVVECQRNLLLQVEHDILDQHGQLPFRAVAAVRVLPVVSRIHDAKHLVDDIHHCVPVRHVVDIHLIHIPIQGIVLHNQVNDIVYFISNSICHNDLFSRLYSGGCPCIRHIFFLTR